MKNRIRELRDAKKLTLTALATKLGVSDSYAFMLQAKKALAAEHRNKLAQIFGVKADEVAPLDEKARVITRRKGAAAAVRNGGGDIAVAVATLRNAVDGIAKSLGAEASEVLSLMSAMSPANRGVLLSAARSLSKNQ